MQLVAYGAQDIYLTGNPQITFFKVVYRRHTNFSMEAIEQTLAGSQGYGNKVSCTISRNGDLISKVYLQVNVDDLLGPNANILGQVAANIGHTLINEVELEIGGQRIDKHYGHWLQTWEELTSPNPTGVKGQITAEGQEPNLFEAGSGNGLPTLSQRMSYNHVGAAVTTDNTAPKPANATIPLQFWFCRNPGLALPLIALQYHEVKISLLYSVITNICVTTGNLPAFPTNRLWVDYIYLDTDERRRFAQQSHEYLIEQLQFQQQGSATATRTELNFNHPVKELIWTGVPLNGVGGAAGDRRASSATPGLLDCTATQNFLLKLNGHDRFTARHRDYFTRTQVHQHHSGFGGTTQHDSIAVYSFALKPEEHQPSGTCNFSRIDNATMEHPAQGADGGANANSGAVPAGKGDGINFYAVNYNVLRIMSGMGGLAYSN